MTPGEITFAASAVVVALIAGACILALAAVAARFASLSRGLNQRVREVESALATRQREQGALTLWKGDMLSALDTLEGWWLRIDEEGIVLAANDPKGLEVAPSGEVVGRPATSLLPESVQQVFGDQLERCRRERRLLAFEFVDAKKRNIAVRVSPLAEGATLWMRDLTTERQRQHLLVESKERFALAAQGSNDGIWDWDLERGTIYWSLNFRKIVGDNALAPTREAWMERVHPEDATSLGAALDAHLEGSDGRVHFSSEHRVSRGDGWAWVLARAQAVRDSKGQATRLAGSLTDLTDRRVVQVTAEKARLLEHATSAVDIGTAVALPDGTLDNASATLTAMATPWGLQPWWAIAGARRPPSSALCSQCGLEERTGTVRVPLGAPDGRRVVHEVSWTGHAHEVFDQPGAHVVMVRDVTEAADAERRLVELNLELETARDAALEANRLKSAFLANMSHELRTPQNHVIGYAEMVVEVLEDGGDADALDDTRRIISSSRALAHTVGRLLDLSRIEAEQVDVTASDVALDPLLQRLTREPDKPGVSITLALDPALDTLLTDGEKLGILLRELIDNAVKFTENGEVQVSATPLPDGLRVTITDPGIGMPPEVIEQLFRGYYQADTSSTRRHDGTGLGLLLAHRLADCLGATIGVKSVENSGTTLTVDVPSAP